MSDKQTKFLNQREIFSENHFHFDFIIYFKLKKSPRFTSVEPMTSLFDNVLLRRAIAHSTQFLGFEFISTDKFLSFSNENFQSIEKYINLKHTRAAIEVDSSPRFKICFFQVSIRHFFTIILKNAWNIRLM